MKEELKNNAFVLRKAVPSDAPRIDELFVEMLQSIFPEKAAEGYEEDYLDKFFAEREDRIYVVELAGNVVAFLSVEVYRKTEYGDYIYIDDFSVTGQYRGCGVGTALMNKSEAYAADLKIPDIYLHVERRNLSAFGFYERRGYAVYREEDERYLLHKNVTEA